MSISDRARLGDGALPELITGFAGSADAVSMCNDTMPAVTHSRLKHLLVAFLARVFGWSPLLAIALGHVVTSAWRGFREA